MHRGYHLGQIPTLGHKARVAADWAMAHIFGREAVSLGQVEQLSAGRGVRLVPSLSWESKKESPSVCASSCGLRESRLESNDATTISIEGGIQGDQKDQGYDSINLRCGDRNSGPSVAL